LENTEKMVSSAANNLSSYVPDVVLQHRILTDNNGLPDQQDFKAVTLFVDISGFTSLAEKLAEEGNKGIEELRNILNYYFGKLINLILSCGGDIVKFAGDALMVVWTDYLLAEGTEKLCRVAAYCGTEIQKIFTEDSGMKVKLSAKIGLDFGPVKITHLGGLDGQWETLVSGDAVIGCTKAEQQAERGQVIITKAIRQFTGESLLKELSGDFFLLEKSPDLRPEPVKKQKESLVVNEQKISSIIFNYLPLSVKSKFEAGQSEWLAELRKVTALFINIPALNQEISIDRNQQIIFMIQEILKKYEGTINKISVDEKGASLLLVFGLPPLAHEDNALRAVLTALDIHKNLAEQKISVSTGICSGRVFCGEVGSPERREYTIIGDAVNFAARLMQSAKGTIVCDPATFNLSSVRISYEELPPVILKGKSGEFAVFKPVKELKETTVVTPGFIGRRKETAILEEKLEKLLKEKASSFLLIQGEAGIGKSKLVSEFTDRVKKSGCPFFIISGNPIEKNRPYHPWKTFFNQVFEYSGMEPPEKVKKNITAFFENNELSLELLPLLNPVLPLNLAESEITEKMPGEVKAENTSKLMVNILKIYLADKPAVLVIEDAHYVDSASWNLTFILRREIAELMVVASSRSVERQVRRGESKAAPEMLPREFFMITEDPGIEKINLKTLSYDEIYSLVCAKLGLEKLSDEAARFIFSRAAGHPLFSEELSYALRDTEMIKIENGAAAFASDNIQPDNLPDNIEGVITSRIDRLSPSQQLALKVASVIGRSFKYKTLEKIYPVAADLPYLIPNLVKMEKLDITLIESPFPELTYTFKHSLISDVVYNLMLNNQRQQLHKAVAEWYEAYYSEDLSQHFSLLAHHWQNAGVTDKTAWYLVKSGEKSINGGIYREALVSLEKARSLLEEGGPQTLPYNTSSHSSPSLFTLHPSLKGFPSPNINFLLAEAYYGLGRLEESRACLENYVELLGYPLPPPDKQQKEFAKAVIKQVFHRFGLYKKEKKPAQIELRLETARAYEKLGQIYYLLSMRMLAAYNAVFLLNIIEEAGSSPRLGRAYSNFALILGFMKLNRVAALYVRKALDSVKKLNDPPTTAWVYQITGLYSIGAGNLDFAGNLLSMAIDSYESFKDLRHKNESLGLLSFSRYLKGEINTSLGLSLASLEMAVQRDDPDLRARGLTALLRNYLILGDPEQVLRARENALKILSEKIDTLLKIQIYALSSLALLRAGDSQEAFEQAEKTCLMLAKSGSAISVLEIEVYSSLTEVLLVSIRGNQPLPQSEVLLSQVFADFEKFSERFLVTRPRFLVWQGLWHYLKGNKPKAAKSWQKARWLSEKLSMQYEKGLASYFLYRYLEQEHYQEAETIFRTIGAKYYLETLSLAVRGER
jgi:class 3 adenylate cyclase/tetratricopeptide (TPR) repeat protein